MLRHAVRALVLDPADRILLVRFRDPSAATDETWWATVGGGIDPGEAPEAALRRELREEAGLEDFEVGPLVWTRRHVFQWAGREIDQRESYYVVRVEPFEARPTVDLLDELVDEHRWWTPDELAESTEVFAPRRLASLLRELLADGPPSHPLDAGV